jgi:hypothetical protein
LKLDVIEESLLALEKEGLNKDDELKKVRSHKEEWTNL